MEDEAEIRAQVIAGLIEVGLAKAKSAEIIEFKRPGVKRPPASDLPEPKESIA